MLKLDTYHLAYFSMLLLILAIYVIVNEMPKLLDFGIITFIGVNSNYMDVLGGIWYAHDV